MINSNEFIDVLIIKNIGDNIGTRWFVWETIHTKYVGMLGIVHMIDILFIGSSLSTKLLIINIVKTKRTYVNGCLVHIFVYGW